MNIAEALAQASSTLASAGVSESRREASSLLSFVIVRPAAFLIAHPEYELTEDERARYTDAIGRRSRREPFQYITGKQEFYGLEFDVGPGVLIPRPETEILVEAAIERLSPLDSPRLLEIGVGTGCISIAVLHSVKHASAVAVDISPIALRTAGRNANKHEVGDRLTLQMGDVFEGLNGSFDLIASNPPYVPATDIAGLQPEVRDFEPHLALSGGLDGLDVVRRIVAGASQLLNSGGSLLIEIGFGEADGVRQIVDPSIWDDVRFLPDLQGIPRIFAARMADRAS